MRKGVAFLPGYRQICAQANSRYLDALAHVDDPTAAIRALDTLTARASSPNGKRVRPFNPISRRDRMLFEALLSGEHTLPSFTNHGLIAKIPRSRRWRVSLSGRRIMAAALKLRELAYPSLYAEFA